MSWFGVNQRTHKILTGLHSIISTNIQGLHVNIPHIG